MAYSIGCYVRTPESAEGITEARAGQTVRVSARAFIDSIPLRGQKVRFIRIVYPFTSDLEWWFWSSTTDADGWASADYLITQSDVDRGPSLRFRVELIVGGLIVAVGTTEITFIKELKDAIIQFSQTDNRGSIVITGLQPGQDYSIEVSAHFRIVDVADASGTIRRGFIILAAGTFTLTVTHLATGATKSVNITTAPERIEIRNLVAEYASTLQPHTFSEDLRESAHLRPILITDGNRFWGRVKFEYKSKYTFSVTYSFYLNVGGQRLYAWAHETLPPAGDWTLAWMDCYSPDWRPFESLGTPEGRTIDTQKEIWLGYVLPWEGQTRLASDGDADVYRILTSVFDIGRPESNWR